MSYFFMSDSLMFSMASFMVLDLPMYFLITNKKERNQVKQRVFRAFMGIAGMVFVLAHGIIQASVT